MTLQLLWYDALVTYVNIPAENKSGRKPTFFSDYVNKNINHNESSRSPNSSTVKREEKLITLLFLNKHQNT